MQWLAAHYVVLVNEFWSYEISKPSIDLYTILTIELRGLTL